MRSRTRLSAALCLVGLCFGVSALPAKAQVGPEFRVNTYTTYNQAKPRVAADTSGNFVVVWQTFGKDGSNYGVIGQRFAGDGSPRGTEFRINTYTSSGQSAPAVASDATGNFVVVWRSFFQDAAGYGIFGQRFASSGAPLGTEFRVNSYTTYNQGHPAVASDSAGNFVVTWDSRAETFSSYGIRGQRYASSGAPLGTEFRVNSYTTQTQETSSITMDGAGRFVVAWESYAQDGSGYGAFAQRFASDGSRLGGEFRVNTTTSNYQREPAVAATPSGDFVVAWYMKNGDGAGYAAFAQRYASSGSPIGGEFRVNGYTTNDQSNPVVAADSSGNFFVVWHSSGSPLDGSSWATLGQRYAADGSPLGGEFRVNTFTIGGQRYPTIASDPGGDFVVAWQSFSQDGNGYGIFGQRFCTSLASVTIGVNGSTTVCPTGTGGLATVADSGGGASTHQWGFRTTMNGAITDIVGQTGTSYTINGADFPGAGTYLLVCTTTPSCGGITTSNEVTVTVDATDATAPVVAPPSATAVTQTLCQ